MIRIKWYCSKLSREVCIELCRWCECRATCEDIPTSYINFECPWACEREGRCMEWHSNKIFLLENMVYAEAECRCSGHNWRLFRFGARKNDKPIARCERCFRILPWNKFDDKMLSQAIAVEMKEE